MSDNLTNHFQDAFDRVLAEYRSIDAETLLARLNSYSVEEFGVYEDIGFPRHIDGMIVEEYASLNVAAIATSYAPPSSWKAYLGFDSADIEAANDYDYAIAA